MRRLPGGRVKERDVVSVPLSELREWSRNTRRHGKRDISAQRESLELFGQIKPIVVWKGNVVAGNGTFRAAGEIGWTSIDAVLVDDWTEEQALLYSIADNKTAELAEWDVAAVVSAYDKLDADMRKVTAWTKEEVKALRGWNVPDVTAEEFAPATLPTHTSFGATPEQAQVIDQAIEKAKTDEGAPDDAEALVMICRRYMEEP